MTNPSYEQWLVFSYDSNESIPIIIGYGHELKHENLVKCTSKLSCKTDSFFVVKKTMDFKNKHIEMYLTYSLVTPKQEEENGEKSQYGFSRGVIYIDNKTYNIKFYGQYNSLQIGEWCYDNIGVVKLESNIFAEQSVEKNNSVECNC